LLLAVLETKNSRTLAVSSVDSALALHFLSGDAQDLSERR